MPLTQDQISELETKHARIAHCRSINGEWECVFRKPKRAEYKQWRARLHNPATAPDATENIMRVCVVHPSPEAFEALLEEWPGIPEACSKAFLHLVGMAVDDDQK